MNPLLQPIESLTLCSDFKAESLSLDFEKDWVFDALEASITTVFVTEYERLLSRLENPNFSRVLVVSTNQLDLFPDHCVVVPSLGEAQDLIEMERIQRDLGF